MKKKSILGIIPAREGSKGLPRKNKLLLNGKPLIAWTIEEAIKSKKINKLIVSTNDEEIISIANDYGCETPFKRPENISTDKSSAYQVISHSLKAFPRFERFIYLQPTSPLRICKDIDSCINYMDINNSKSIVSVSKPKISPHLIYKLKDKKKIQPLIKSKKIINNRQNYPDYYYINGSIYVANTNWYIKRKTFISSETISYIMPQDRSVDIDTIEDFIIADYYLSKR